MLRGSLVEMCTDDVGDVQLVPIEKITEGMFVMDPDTLLPRRVMGVWHIPKNKEMVCRYLGVRAHAHQMVRSPNGVWAQIGDVCSVEVAYDLDFFGLALDRGNVARVDGVVLGAMSIVYDRVTLKLRGVSQKKRRLNETCAADASVVDAAVVDPFVASSESLATATACFAL